MGKINLTNGQRRWIVVGIAVIFLLMGALRGVFNIGFEGTLLKNIEFVLMVLAFSVLFGGRKKTEEQKEDQAEDYKEEVIADTTAGEDKE